MRGFRSPALVLLCSLLALGAGMKFLSGTPERLPYSSTLYWASAIIETGCCLGLAVRHLRRGAAMFALAFAATGATYAMIFRPTRCGCMGSILDLSWREELMVASLMGLLASWVLLSEGRHSGAARSILGSR
jgi:hypothetical protein